MGQKGGEGGRQNELELASPAQAASGTRNLVILSLLLPLLVLGNSISNLLHHVLCATHNISK